MFENYFIGITRYGKFKKRYHWHVQTKKRIIAEGYTFTKRGAEKIANGKILDEEWNNLPARLRD